MAMAGSACYSALHFSGAPGRETPVARAPQTRRFRGGTLAGRPPERSGFHNFLRYWLPVLLYVTIIISLSAQPNLKPPLRFHNADKLYHFAEYLGLGLLLARALRATLRVRMPLFAAMMAMGIGMAVGASDEIFQSTIPGRESSVFDFLADSAGVMIAQLVYLFFARD
jgi:VanZ family protein